VVARRAAVSLPRMKVEHLGIVGTGLIGASVGLAAKRAGVGHVVGYDSMEGTAQTARDRGAIDSVATDIREFEPTDLVVVAVPVIDLPSVTADVLADGRDWTVTDVGSTKAGVCGTVSNASRFVGGHPVTGSEAQGPEHANAELFDGATWFLTPTAQTKAERYRLVHGFVSSLGATPVAIDPLAHDRLVALTSHLPHALANVLVNQAGAARIDGHEPLAAAGGSLRDMTRVAGANPRIWVDIFLENADVLADALAEHRGRLEQVERALHGRDAGFLAKWIGEAALNRRAMLAEAYPDPGALQRVRVHVPDRPGVLAGITQALGAERINIEDFELQHMSPDRGGTLTLLITGEEEANRAADLLEAQGYGAVVAPVLGQP
jgi:prephenate dehydrogenase